MMVEDRHPKDKAPDTALKRAMRDYTYRFLGYIGRRPTPSATFTHMQASQHQLAEPLRPSCPYFSRKTQTNTRSLPGLTHTSPGSPNLNYNYIRIVSAHVPEPLSLVALYRHTLATLVTLSATYMITQPTTGISP